VVVVVILVGGLSGLIAGRASEAAHRDRVAAGPTPPGPAAPRAAAGPAAAPASAPAPAAAAPAALRAFADRIAVPWMRRRTASGLFVDPLTGGARHGFGQVMLGDALMRAGLHRGNGAMLRAGVTAITRSVRRSSRSGLPENPLGLVALTSAYRWAGRHLADRMAFRRARASWRHELETWSQGDVGPKAQRCFHDPVCWDNYKPLEAAGELRLRALGLHPATTASVLARAGGAAAAHSVLQQRFDQATGQGAAWSGVNGAQARLGINSDQPTYPLAYQPMTAMALAAALDRHRPQVGAAGQRAFARVMAAQTAVTAPDGDVSYLGRAQGQSWALAATVYAARVCALRFSRSRPLLAGRCATLATRAMRRLQDAYGHGSVGVNVIPRYRTSPLDARGMDAYARVMTYNGMTAVLLDWAADVPAPAAPAVPAALPLDADGAFTDPRHAHLAVVRHGAVWFAVHDVGPIGVFDARYGFGLLSARVRGPHGTWHQLVPPPPRVSPQTALSDSGGPLLPTAGGLVTAWGRTLRARPRTGAVIVQGGFRTTDGRWVAGGDSFVYRALSDGVVLTVHAAPGQQLTFQDWVPAGTGRAAGDGRVLRLPGSRMVLSPRPASTVCDGRYASAYSVSLVSCRRTVTVPPGGRVRWTVRRAATATATADPTHSVRQARGGG
jgi:hypothetical protein